jgi:hypothetical protein
MRLDRYAGEEPKFKILRRQPDGSYVEVPAFDYFVLALKDKYAHEAIRVYASEAFKDRNLEYGYDVARLHLEAMSRDDIKTPD